MSNVEWVVRQAMYRIVLQRGGLSPRDAKDEGGEGVEGQSGVGWGQTKSDV